MLQGFKNSIKKSKIRKANRYNQKLRWGILMFDALFVIGSFITLAYLIIMEITD